MGEPQDVGFDYTYDGLDLPTEPTTRVRLFLDPRPTDEWYREFDQLLEAVRRDLPGTEVSAPRVEPDHQAFLELRFSSAQVVPTVRRLESAMQEATAALDDRSDESAPLSYRVATALEDAGFSPKSPNVRTQEWPR